MAHDNIVIVPDDVSSAGRDRMLIRRALLTFCHTVQKYYCRLAIPGRHIIGLFH